MNRAQLKELVKNIMSEESEYQAFFQKALEKAGKSIPSMSDDEKKAFFNKIDSTWDGKGEKNEGNAFGAAVTAAKKAGEDKFKVGGETYKVEEELVGGQKKLDVDGDGEIEASDLADLRAGKKADEAIELPSATLPSAVKSKLMMAIDKIKDSNLTYNQKIQVVGQVMDSLGIDKAEFNKMASKLKGTMESVNEATLINLKNNSDAQTIAAKSKLSYEDSWNAITSYLVATMGLPKALALVLKLEKEYDKIFSESKINEATTSSAPGEWVAYLSMTRGKKLLNTFNTARGAKQFLSKNVDKLLSGANVESVGIMSKKQWDEREAKYAVESVNESLTANDGKILLNGKPVGYYDYDRDSAAFWTTDLSDKQFRGDKAFDTKEEMLAFFKKYISRAAKAIEYKRKALAKFGIKYPADESVNEAAKPTIKVVNKLKNEEGIQIVVTKTTDGETMYGGFVVRGKLQKVIPVGANSSKEGVKKRALQIWDEFGKQLGESINEGNAFGMAVTAAKKEGLKEFEFNGKMYKVKQGSYEKNEAAKKPVVLSGFTLVPEKKK
jgi:hypothetical protein